MACSVEVKRDLSVLYTNARSLIPKRDELLAYIDVEKPDVIAITETWATSDHLMIKFSIPGYESFQKNRLHKKGGGVICFVKSNYPAVIISKQNSEKYDTSYTEVATSRHNKLSIGTVYRPPKQQAADDTALYAEIQAMTKNKQSVIIGNFNCPNNDWTTLSGDQEGNRLLEMLEDAFLTQIVTQPTRAMSPSWITSQVQQAINLKKRRYNFLKKNNTNEARDQYHQSLRAAEISFDSVNATLKNKLRAKPNPSRRCFFTYTRTKKKAKSRRGRPYGGE